MIVANVIIEHKFVKRAFLRLVAQSVLDTSDGPVFESC